MYWIRTNLQRVQPLNLKCQMLIFHYIVEFKLSFPLHEQPKDEIIFLGIAQWNYMCA